MTIYRTTVLDTPGELGRPRGLRADDDCALVVRDGTIIARTDITTARREHPGHEEIDLREGLLLPGLVDTHVHFPQVRALGGLGMPLLEWLRLRALPEEARLADPAYAREVAREFLGGLSASGTTTAMVFGSHFPGAVDVLFQEAEQTGLRITSGLVVSDRILREDLLLDPAATLEAGRELAQRWHGRGRLRYAVTPRFALSTTDEMLAASAELLHEPQPGLAGGLWLTSHINENLDEIAQVRHLFPDAADYLDTYARHGLVGPRSVLAHNVHPQPEEVTALAAAGAAVAHCPTSNSALGSGMFPLREHLDAGVQVALGSDVGAGTGFGILKEGLQAHFMQQLRGPAGMQLGAADLLHLATRSGALALGLAEEVGDLSTGKQFDAVWVRPRSGATLETVLRHADDAEDALAKLFALGTSADIESVWVSGQEITHHRPMAVGLAPEGAA